MFQCYLAPKVSRSTSGRSLSSSDSGTDFTHIPNTSYPPRDDTTFDGLPTSFTIDSDAEDSQDSLSLPALAADITFRRGQRRSPGPSFCYPESLCPVHRAPVFKLAKANSEPSGIQKPLSVDSEGINRKARSIQPSAVQKQLSGGSERVSQKTRSIKGANTKFKGRIDDDSFMPPAVSLGPTFSEAVEKQSPSKGMKVTSKGHADTVSMPATIPRPPVFKLAARHSAPQAVHVPATPKSPTSLGRKNRIVAPQVSENRLSEATLMSSTLQSQTSPCRKARVDTVPSSGDEAVSSSIRTQSHAFIPNSNMPYPPPCEGTLSATPRSRGKSAAKSSTKKQVQSDGVDTKPTASPVQMKTSVHKNENGVMVTNNFYLLTADSFAGVNNHRDAGSDAITAEINKIVEGQNVHVMTVDEIWKCIFQLKGYGPDTWLAILAKCGVAEDRWPQLLHIMHLASRDRRKVDRYVFIAFPELSANALACGILVPSHKFSAVTRTITKMVYFLNRARVFKEGVQSLFARS